MRTEWTQLLMLPGLGSDLSASITRRPGKLANDPEDQMQLAGQTLLSLADLFRHEKAFRVLMERLLGVFEKGPEGIRQALLEKIRAAQFQSLDLQSSSSELRWSGDPLGIAARLICGGTMRGLGDVILQQ